MYIYNVTVKVDHEVKENWLEWMKNEHLPMVMNTGCFEEYKILRLLLDETDGETFAIQYLVKDIPTLEYYQKEFGPALRQESEKHFGERALAFRSVLEIL